MAKMFETIAPLAASVSVPPQKNVLGKILFPFAADIMFVIFSGHGILTE
jgi:hypothetical protein